MVKVGEQMRKGEANLAYCFINCHVELMIVCRSAGFDIEKAYRNVESKSGQGAGECPYNESGYDKKGRRERRHWPSNELLL